MLYNLSEAHMKAVNRRRRLISHYDAQTVGTECGFVAAQTDMSLFEAYEKRLWGYFDTLDHQFDSIHWDACMEDEFAFGRKSKFTQVRMDFVREMYAEGHDLYQAYVDGCRKRNLECILTHRISGTDNSPGREPSPMKLKHPEYYITDWQRGQNLAVPEIRQMKMEMLTECMENYEFDGLEIDFCRHTPFLEPGRQWELREHVTKFMRMLRDMTLRIEKEQNRPILLSARVPEKVEGCHMDGLDIEAWAEEGLVDTLTIGSRSFEVDIPAFRRATKGRVKLFPCFDAHHQSDAYHDPEVDIYAGVFSDWWEQGADAIALFNLYACDWETYKMTSAHPFRPHRHHLEEVLCFAGDPDMVSKMDKTYVVERKGGYPWENGFANNNNYKQLPVILKNNGASEMFMLYAADAISRRSVQRLSLRVVVYGLGSEDHLIIKLNGVALSGDVDHEWKDKQIIPLGKERVSGYHTDYLDERPECFSRFECMVDAALIHKGENYVSLSVERAPYYPFAAMVEAERIELNIVYCED